MLLMVAGHVARWFTFWSRREACSAEAKGGGMAAVVGLEISRVQALLDEHQLTGSLTIANRNSPHPGGALWSTRIKSSAGPVLKCRMPALFGPSRQCRFHSPRPAAEQFQ